MYLSGEINNFEFERLRALDTFMETFEYRNSWEKNNWIFGRNYRMETKSDKGSIQTPWFEEKYSDELFSSNVDYRFGMIGIFYDLIVFFPLLICSYIPKRFA